MLRSEAIINELLKGKKKSKRTGNSGNVPPMEGQMISQGEPTQPYFTDDKKYMARVDKVVEPEATRMVRFIRGGGSAAQKCGTCYFYDAEHGCFEIKALMDPEIPDAETQGYKDVKDPDWCRQWTGSMDTPSRKADGVPQVKKHDTSDKTRISGFVPGGGNGQEQCGNCAFYCGENGCHEPKVLLDTDVPDSGVDGYKAVKEGDWCEQWANDQADATGTIKTDGVPRFSKFVQITKVDEAKRLVGGVVTAEVIDKVGECCDYKSTKPYYEKWSTDLSKATDGKNLGNLREMHGLSAAGAGKSIDFNDDDKTIYMTFKVVDDNAWKKVTEGVYTGFSHGGDYIRKWNRGDDNVKMYTARPTEVSLVDLPCLPEATFDFVRADGSHEVRKFAHGGKDVTAGNGQQPDLNAIIKRLETMESGLRPMLASAMHKTRASIVLANFRKTEANKENINKAIEATCHKVAKRMGLQKDMYTLKSFAQILQDLAYIRMSCEYEAQREGDDSQLPAALQGDLESLAESFLTMAQEEVGELVQAADNAGTSTGYMYVDQGGQMKKLSAAEFQQLVADATSTAVIKAVGVETAKEMGFDEPKPQGKKPKDATDPDYSISGPGATSKTLKTEHKLENGDTLKVYSDGSTEVIAKGSAPLSETEIQKRIDEGVQKGIDNGLQTLIRAMYDSDEEAEAVLKAAKKAKPAGSASGSPSGSASGSESGSTSGDQSGSASGPPPKTKKADGIGDRTATGSAAPIVNATVPFSKSEDNRMVDNVLKTETPGVVDQETVIKAFSGDATAALKVMKGAKPTDVPPTLMDALGKVSGGRV